jgi:hypothetical protein
MSQKYDIFISYRRKGGIKDARLVDEKLRNSGYSVSFDIDTLGRGKFTDTLKNRLKDCKDFIVIFEPTYYERFYDENGNIQPEKVLNEDWCYLELKNALLLNKNIIPLVQKDFVFPGNLPKDIKEIAEMNAIQLTEKEFKEIFEHKVKSYLISKPKFTHRHKKSIITVLSLVILAVIAGLVSFSLDAQKMAKTEAARAAAEAERAVFIADSVKKAAEEQTKSILDSINKAKNTEKATEKKRSPIAATAATSSANTNPKTELYWAGNGDETGRILFEKLSGANFKSGECAGNGIKVSASSKPACSSNPMGGIKCSYTPQLTVATCSGSPKDKLIFGQTFSSSNKDDGMARQKILESLKSTNFGEWIRKLKALRG